MVGVVRALSFSLPTVKGTVGEKRAKWEVNVGAVMGQMSTGGGHDRLFELDTGNNGVPGMSKKMYLNTENRLAMLGLTFWQRKFNKQGWKRNI